MQTATFDFARKLEPDLTHLALFTSGAGAASEQRVRARELKAAADSIKPVVRVIREGRGVIQRMIKGTRRPNDPRPCRTHAEAKAALAGVAALTATLARVVSFFETSMPAMMKTVPARGPAVREAMRELDTRRREAAELAAATLEDVESLTDVFLATEARLNPENDAPAVAWETVRAS